MRNYSPILYMSAAFAGLFAAATLSFAHLLDLAVPCGRSHGCDLVATHASSKLFGVPIALFGVAAYVALIMLASRPMVGRRASLAFVSLAGFGTATSAGLLIYSQVVIHATCWWCVASGVAMAVLFLSGLALVRGGRSLPTVKPALVWGLAAVTAAAVGIQAGLMQRAANAPPIPARQLAGLTAADLVDPAKTLGPEDAPITIVEFGDLFCTACRAVHADLVRYQEKNPSKIRLAYRHLPLHELRGHELSAVAATMGEMAAEQGQFWAFVDGVYGQPHAPDLDSLLEIVPSVGLDADEVRARLEDSEDPALQRLNRDIDLADRLGADSTPTFVLLVEGQEPRSASARLLPRILSQPEVLSLIAAAQP